MLKIYNSLTRQIEPFTPQRAPQVTMYTCGPTVYDFAHIGNFRTYMMADMLMRTLKLDGYTVKFIMNLTDVGHLTGDNLGDADTGEDRMEKSAKKEGKSAWEIAEFYTDAFLKDYDALHLTRPEEFAKATDHIKEQITLIETLEENGYAYTISDGVYFDTAAFPSYGEMSNLDQIKEGARVEVNPEKRNPRDFALWKFSEKRTETPFDKAQGDDAKRRQMEWDSPWGKGFPGWHIECSAMSMAYLGETIDLHTGGIDLRETHHPNEIAQSEAATHRKFVRYWAHSAFMLVAGERMSKSMKNNYRLYDLEKEGFEPLAVRYLYMQTHYRQEMNFTFASLEAAQNAVVHLLREIVTFAEPVGNAPEHEKQFKDALNDDLNTPQALSIMWDLIKSDVPSENKVNTLYMMDEILGFNLRAYRESELKRKPIKVPSEVIMLVEERQILRKSKQYSQADQVRNKILKLGYEVVDTKNGYDIREV